MAAVPDSSVGCASSVSSSNAGRHRYVQRASLGVSKPCWNPAPRDPATWLDGAFRQPRRQSLDREEEDPEPWRGPGGRGRGRDVVLDDRLPENLVVVWDFWAQSTRTREFDAQSSVP